VNFGYPMGPCVRRALGALNSLKPVWLRHVARALPKIAPSVAHMNAAGPPILSRNARYSMKFPCHILRRAVVGNPASAPPAATSTACPPWIVATPKTAEIAKGQHLAGPRDLLSAEDCPTKLVA
jgi:hypothetical protein